jgi:hypothetical protein
VAAVVLRRLGNPNSSCVRDSGCWLSRIETFERKGKKTRSQISGRCGLLVRPGNANHEGENFLYADVTSNQPVGLCPLEESRTAYVHGSGWGMQLRFVVGDGGDD